MKVHSVLAMALGAVVALGAAEARAQALPGYATQDGPFSAPTNSPRVGSDPNPVAATSNTSASRLSTNRRGSAANNTRRPAAPDPAEVIALAQTQAQAAGIDCQVTEAVARGMMGENAVYEAACASGPGYLLIASAPPQAVDCTILSSQAEITRETDPAAAPGTACEIPANTDILRVVSVYARDAGVACQVDRALAVGRSSEGETIYEVGCAGVQGYWIKKAGSTWTSTECLEVMTQETACRFTTPEENAASVKAMLAGSQASDCDVTQARFMGGNSNGRFYEAKCAAGNGVIARIQQAAVQQVYPCEQAQRIGGGCTLTQVAAAPATTEQN